MILRRSAALLLLALPVLAASCDEAEPEPEQDMATTIDSIKTEGSHQLGVMDSAMSAAQEELARGPAERHLRPDEVAWAPVGRWSGTGDKGTERFQVGSDEWRLVGVLEPLNDAEKSWVVVKIFNDRREHLQTFSIEAAGTDTGYVNVEPGVYYMTVGTQQARWSLTAEERRLPAEQVRAAQ